jgi:hypothetical protein
MHRQDPCLRWHPRSAFPDVFAATFTGVALNGLFISFALCEEGDECPPPLILNPATMARISWAWALSSSEALADSSELAAFC